MLFLPWGTQEVSQLLVWTRAVLWTKCRRVHKLAGSLQSPRWFLETGGEDLPWPAGHEASLKHTELAGDLQQVEVNGFTSGFGSTMEGINLSGLSIWHLLQCRRLFLAAIAEEEIKLDWIPPCLTMYHASLHPASKTSSPKQWFLPQNYFLPWLLGLS